MWAFFCVKISLNYEGIARDWCSICGVTGNWKTTQNKWIWNIFTQLRWMFVIIDPPRLQIWTQAGPCRQQRTALMQAAKGGHVEVVRWLLEEGGADPHRTMKDGSRVFDWAVMGGTRACFLFLLNSFWFHFISLCISKTAHLHNLDVHCPYHIAYFPVERKREMASNNQWPDKSAEALLCANPRLWNLVWLSDKREGGFNWVIFQFRNCCWKSDPLSLKDQKYSIRPFW